MRAFILLLLQFVVVFSYCQNVGIGTNNPSEKLEVIGNLKTSGTVQIGDYTLPNTDGTVGQVLQTDGNGNLSWINMPTSELHYPSGLLYLPINKINLWPVTSSSTSLWTAGYQNPNYLVDNANNNDTYFANNYPIINEWIQIKLDTFTIISEFKWTQSNNDTHGVWRMQTSVDALTWVDRGTITLGGSTQSLYPMEVDTNKYLYFRIIGLLGNTSNSPWLYEMDLKIEFHTTPTYPVGDKTSIWTATNSTNNIWASTTYSNPNKLIDGANSNDIYFANGRAVLNEWIQIEIDVLKEISEFSWGGQSDGSSHGNWRMQTSINGTTWVNRGDIVLGGSSSVIAYPMTTDHTQYKFFRILGLSGVSSSSPWLYEMNLRVK